MNVSLSSRPPPTELTTHEHGARLRRTRLFMLLRWRPLSTSQSSRQNLNPTVCGPKLVLSRNAALARPAKSESIQYGTLSGNTPPRPPPAHSAPPGDQDC